MTQMRRSTIRAIQTSRFPNETVFTDSVIELLKMAGFLVHHDRGKMKSHIQGHAGFPDIFALRGQRMIVAELKMDGEHPTEPQRHWLRTFALWPLIETYVWKPSQWDEITQIIVRR